MRMKPPVLNNYDNIHIMIFQGYKKHLFAAVSIVALSFLAMKGDDSTVSFKSFKVSPSVSLMKPAVPYDSIHAERNAFSSDMLLGAVNRKLKGIGNDWTEISADTANVVFFSKSLQSAQIRTLATRMRPSRYVSGNLRLKSNVITELRNGSNTLLTISKADSLASWESTAFTLAPEETAELFVTFVSTPDDPASPEISLEFIPDVGFENVSFAVGDTISKRFLIENSALGTRVKSVSVSPDGKYAILAYESFYGEGRLRKWSELQECATGKTINASLSSNAVWADKGSTLYITVQTDDTYSLYSMDAATQRQTLVASDLPRDSFIVSPDGSYLLLYKYVEGKKDNGPLKRIQEPDDRLAGNRDCFYIEKYDIHSGITQPLTYSGNTTAVSDISADSNKIIFQTTDVRPDSYPFYYTSLIQLDVNTLETDTLVKDDPYVKSAVYSPDAKQIFITGSPEAFGGIGKDRKDRKYSNDYDVQGFIMDVTTHSVRPVTVDFAPSIEDHGSWNRKNGLIYFSASDGFDLNVYTLDPKTDKITCLEIDMPYVLDFSVGSDDNRWLYAVGADFSYTGRCVALDLKSGKLRLVDDPYRRDFSDTLTGEESSWTFKSTDGTMIDCMQVLPPDFDANKKYPMIVYYYGGCAPTQKGVNVYDPHIFASRGYVTLVMNPSGTYGYGQDFAARHANAWGDYTADDIICGVKEFCRTHTYVDEKKIGCIGASYGGFMTQYLQTKTDIFAAAVSHAGISNVTSYWGEGNWGYSYNVVAAPESYPWNNPDLFTKHGSLFNADKIHTPLLLLHGNVDTNVPVGESIQLFNALRILGRDVEFIQVDGENHYISNYDKRKIWQATIMAWFAKHLQDAPQWWDSMYGK